MITADTTEIFPVNQLVDVTGGPDYGVRRIELPSGRAKIRRSRAYPLHEYTVPLGGNETYLYDLLEFFHANGVGESVFRYVDTLDFRSARPGSAITPLDQPLTDAGGSTWQLFKEYTSPSGNIVQTRLITKPRGATLRVANGSGVEQSSSNWTIDEGAGLLTIGGGFSGTPTTWGAEFYVPVRLVSKFDARRAARNAGDVTLVFREEP